MATKERRPKGLKLPLIPQREDTHPVPLPLPMPLPAPPPSAASSGAAQFCGRAQSRDAAAQSTPEEEVDPSETVRIKPLGHGSSGKVYKVKHKKTGKVYALKVIQEKHEAMVRKQIMREMEILRRAKAGNVVRCYGASDKGGEIMMVLEYMDGGSLADVLEKHGEISERCLSNVAKQVLKGLSYLHSNKIVHRDIKPSNLLLNKRQEVKIADFGVSTVLASTMAPCSSFVGTCAYMSPERFDPDSHGGHYCGYAADIWSLGLSLLECATGHFPFVAPGQHVDWPTLMVSICYGEPPLPPPHVSPHFRDFIMRCLQKDPSRRPRASALLSHPFITRSDDSSSPSDLSSLLHSLAL